MSNSFYYFFSATPQVLAGILALFGVFVIFKIQTIKSELIAIGRLIYQRGERLYESGLRRREQSLSPTKDKIVSGIYKCLASNDVNELTLIIDKVNDADFISDEEFRINLEKYKEEYIFLQSLKKMTIKWSIFTAITIIICLIILSQGNYFLSHPVLLSIIFWFIITLIGVSFFGLIYILIKSLKE